MTQTMKKAISLLLVFVQLFVLFPVLQPQAEAAQSETETPVLNKTIVGTVKFQSFNFLGDNATGEDGTDYQTTFYYTDDYFAPSAINDAADSRTMLWSDLDNPSLAACSMDFAVAAMTSADGDVVSPSSRTWDNSDYSAARKEKNVRDFLSACGFTEVECTELDKRPRNDSIGYTIGSKQITVWNADTQKNEQYTLIAVGVRGAGYGQEWASNISIGDPATGTIPASGRHWGFDDGAKKVCDGISTYLRKHSITGNVKYWITGFSRAAAVANLAAGYLTDDGSTYKTQPKDVFGYTWECPQAAKKTSSPDTNFTNYKNIHNILNPMDAVPKVSPDEFEHQRLGVDYQMPYHGTPNLSNSNHTAMYNRMFEVLKTIAVGNGTDPDPLVDDKSTSNDSNDGYVSPTKYPYNKAMTIYKMDAGELMGQVVAYALNNNNDTLLKEFGTVEAEHQHKGGLFNLVTYGNVKSLLGWNGGSDYKTTTWYLDDFIENLVGIFLTSNAWVGGTGTGRTPLQNRATFISNYQNDFRTLFGYFLDLAGPAFLGLMPKLIDAVTSNIGTSLTSGFAWDFVRFYNDPSNTSKKNNLISSSKTLAVDVANDMAGTFSDAPYQGITKSQMNDAMRNLAELVINLYSYELSEFDSQYLGTTLHYLNTILCVHEQETVLSWIMSLDPNHMNRSCRTITIPAGCSATLYEYRPEYEGSIDETLHPAAPVVAEVKNGVLVTDTLKDERIYAAANSNGTVTIRYPASLQIRADITSGSVFSASAVTLRDYKTIYAYTNVSGGKDLFKTTALSSAGYNSVTNTAYTNVTAANSSLTQYSDQILPGDTLHVMADEITAFDGRNASAYTLLVDKAPNAIVVDYDVADGGLTSGADASGAAQLRVDADAHETVDADRSIRTRQTTVRVPASSVYFDDDFADASLTGTPGESVFSTVSKMLEVDGATQYWYAFSGTGIDVYCTTYSENADGTAAGFVQAKILDADGDLVTVTESQRDTNGNVTTVSRDLTAAVVNRSDTTRYNVPTISFHGLNAGQQYYLVLQVLKSSHYKLDGIRVYNPGAASNEDAAAFVNLHTLLLGKTVVSGLADQSAAGAAFYVDHAEEGESHNLALVSEDYANDSPLNEIYLANGQSVAFQINGTYDSAAVGLSAPDNDGIGSVIVTDQSGVKTLRISSVVDTYYTVEPNANRCVVITNDSDVLISVTNVRLEGFQPFRMQTTNEQPALVVSRELKAYAMSFRSIAPVEETQPTPEPTADLTNTVQQLLSSFIQSLFGGIARLFGN